MTHNMNEIKVVVGLITSWTGTATAFLGDHWVALCGLLISAFGTGFAIVAARATTRARKTEQAHLEAEMCADCQHGIRPPRCPIEKHRQPHNCPLREAKTLVDEKE